ncbi:hypothetical protein [Niabella ginsengisoli]|uniref:Copper resistance protein NlpE n=1 Tax=Niabella ginsengisoli TaxID=522298 RepID=A0ABS9SHU3_9BACT|nr:hypothetical protein [Niabella ginsengisoli]MCH5597938.1 hypothetical protein [Niabella ginsengisoli]
MKNVYWALLIIGIISCGAGQERAAGTFTRSIDHEFATGTDTLIIKPVNEKVYKIEKRSTYHRILNGQLKPPESHKQTWTGIMDEKAQLIKVENNGKILLFSDDQQRVMLGALEYELAADK